MYDGEVEVYWLVFLHDFLTVLHEEDGCSNKHASLLHAHKHHESQRRWCCSLLADSVHSLEHFYDLIEDTFHYFGLEHGNQKLLQQQKESPMDFWHCFHDF